MIFINYVMPFIGYFGSSFHTDLDTFYCRDKLAYLIKNVNHDIFFISVDKFKTTH